VPVTNTLDNPGLYLLLPDSILRKVQVLPRNGSLFWSWGPRAFLVSLFLLFVTRPTSILSELIFPSCPSTIEEKWGSVALNARKDLTDHLEILGLVERFIRIDPLWDQDGNDDIGAFLAWAARMARPTVCTTSTSDSLGAETSQRQGLASPHPRTGSAH